MKLIQAATAATFLAALLAAGSAQAQLKSAEPASPAAITPPAGPSQAPQVPQQQQPQPQMPDPLSKEFHACSQKARDEKKAEDPITAMGCFKAETRRQEGKIAAGVTRLAKLTTAAEKKRLDEANTAWRHFRDAECGFFADPAGVPPEAAANSRCVLDRTIRRALDMDDLARAYVERESDRKAAAQAPAAPAPAPAAPAKK